MPMGDATATTQALYDSYRQWAQANGEFPMTLKRLSTTLANRRYEKWKHPESRRAGYKGISILNGLGAEFNA
jgi:phage/plasmid-associated DNA primase